MHRTRITGLVAAAVLGFAIVGVVAQAPTTRYDVIVRHGTVLDGAGNAALPRRCRHRRRVDRARGDLGEARAEVEIDATGLYVAPGFVNIHSHATPDGLMTAVNMLTQGVTTEIVNADGSGPLDLDAQLADAAARGLAVNVGANIGFNSAWSEVVGLADRRPPPTTIARMRGWSPPAWPPARGACRPDSTTSRPTSPRPRTSSRWSRWPAPGGPTSPTTIG